MVEILVKIITLRYIAVYNGNFNISGTNIFDKFPATVHNAGSGARDQDGLGQSRDGVRSELPAMHVARPARHSRERAEGDDLPQDSHHQPRHLARPGSAVTESHLPE